VQPLIYEGSFFGIAAEEASDVGPGLRQSHEKRPSNPNHDEAVTVATAIGNPILTLPHT